MNKEIEIQDAIKESLEKSIKLSFIFCFDATINLLKEIKFINEKGIKKHEVFIKNIIIELANDIDIKTKNANLKNNQFKEILIENLTAGVSIGADYFFSMVKEIIEKEKEINIKILNTLKENMFDELDNIIDNIEVIAIDKKNIH